MSRRSYIFAALLFAVLSAAAVASSPELLRVGAYSIHDSIALVFCNPKQMYACGFGSEWNSFTYCLLGAIICGGVFVYSNSYAYPVGFRTLSILRFGSERRYWAAAMRRNLSSALFAATGYVLAALACCALFQWKRGFGAVQFVTYGQYTVVYVLFWLKLLAALSLIGVFAEVFAQRMARAGIIGAIVIAAVVALSVDIFQKRSAILAVGGWHVQAAALVGLLAVQAVLLIYGRLRLLRI